MHTTSRAGVLSELFSLRDAGMVRFNVAEVPPKSGGAIPLFLLGKRDGWLLPCSTGKFVAKVIPDDLGVEVRVVGSPVSRRRVFIEVTIAS